MRLLDEQKHNIEKVNEYKGIIKQLYHIISLKNQVVKEYSEVYIYIYFLFNFI